VFRRTKETESQAQHSPMYFAAPIAGPRLRVLACDPLWWVTYAASMPFFIFPMSSALVDETEVLTTSSSSFVVIHVRDSWWQRMLDAQNG
jgi:hypothetical protein